MSPKKLQDWQTLTDLTQGRAFVVEQIRLTESDIAIKGAFDLPQLAQLTCEDQVFVAAFLRSHGSIKEMEQVFGISYPTVKARLNRIAGQLDFVEVNPQPLRSDALERLSRGEISAEDAIKELEGRS
ncbi:MAG: RNA polymerase subunit sigma-70 [Phenylobacterium zucineum]|nr:MAG: RNA polymerase subunit sigma-70 [Phenylobacterium zucineum]